MFLSLQNFHSLAKSTALTNFSLYDDMTKTASKAFQLGSLGAGGIEEGRGRGEREEKGEGEGEGVSCFARIWGRIINAYNSETVTHQYGTLFLLNRVRAINWNRF